MFLSENIGRSVSRDEILEKVFEFDKLQDVKKHSHITNQQGAIMSRMEQQLTKLQKFAQTDFRKIYLVRDNVTDSLSLRQSFSDKYFIFKVLRSTKD